MRVFLWTTLTIILLATVSCNNTSDIQKSEKNVATINVQIGMEYLARGDMQKAKEKFLLALDQDPTLPEAWYSMARFFTQTGDLNSASEYYLRAIKLAPNRGEVQNNYGTFLCQTGHFEQAVQRFLLATQDLHYLETASAYENAGLCSLKIPNNQQAALTYFNKALQQDANMPTSMLESAKIYYQAGHIAQAKEMMRQLLLISPVTPTIAALQQKLK